MEVHTKVKDVCDSNALVLLFKQSNFIPFVIPPPEKAKTNLIKYLNSYIKLINSTFTLGTVSKPFLCFNPNHDFPGLSSSDYFSQLATALKLDKTTNDELKPSDITKVKPFILETNPVSKPKIIQLNNGNWNAFYEVPNKVEFSGIANFVSENSKNESILEDFKKGSEYLKSELGDKSLNRVIFSVTSGNDKIGYLTDYIEGEATSEKKQASVDNFREFF